MKIIVQRLEEWQKKRIKKSGYFMFKCLYFLWKKAVILIRVCIKIVQKGSKEIPLTL